MTEQVRGSSMPSPYGRAGLTWYGTLALALATIGPSTFLLVLPAAFGATYLPAVLVVAWLVTALGIAGTVGGTLLSALSKDYGWWPVPVALVAQWVAAWTLYPMVW